MSCGQSKIKVKNVQLGVGLLGIFLNYVMCKVWDFTTKFAKSVLIYNIKNRQNLCEKRN